MLKNVTPLLLIILWLSTQAQQTVGLFTKANGSADGYVLFAPIHSDTTYLIDKCGKLVHTWVSNRTPGLSVYLLADGSLLRTESIMNQTFQGNGASGGQISRYDWNGNLLWQYRISDTLQTQNHDVCPMPNGNILVAVWEKVSLAQAIAAGRDTALLGTRLWSAKLIELQPTGTNQATIVWQWRLWDHLVQDYDSTKQNYGVVANHPELMNLNYTVGNAATNPDWIHLNAVTYNADLNQVMISTHSLSELWIIDHNTTNAEASSHAGGAHGKGGDFLYRWGNPAAYKHGTVSDQRLYQQHNPTWIPNDCPGAGNIMVFNNGVRRPSGDAASVDIITPPIDSLGNYTLVAGQAYGPASSYWSYMAPTPTDFFTQTMGGAQRLPNGNTIVCEADKGNFFEVDSNKNLLWRYVNPVGTNGPISQGNIDTSLAVFRCTFFSPSNAAFTGVALTSGNPIELHPLPSICDSTAGIAQASNENKISVSPNPANRFLNISSALDYGLLKAELMNSAGILLMAAPIVNGQLQLNVSVLPAGLYFLRISGKDIVQQQSVSIER